MWWIIAHKSKILPNTADHKPLKHHGTSRSKIVSDTRLRGRGKTPPVHYAPTTIGTYIISWLIGQTGADSQCGFTLRDCEGMRNICILNVRMDLFWKNRWAQILPNEWL